MTLSLSRLSLLTVIGSAFLLSGCEHYNNTKSTEMTVDSTEAMDGPPVGASLLAQGAYYDKIGDHQEAQRLYRQALVQEPSDINVRNNMALSLLLSGNTKESAAILQSVVNDPEATAKHRNNLALVYGLMDRENAARLLLEQDLNDAQVAQNMALYNALRQRPEKLQETIFPQITGQKKSKFSRY